ncbi:hypothetical protein D3C71_1926120 [compost metagenome]
MSEHQTKDQRLELMLRDLQVAIERTHASGEQRRRRRAVLRGFRAALWASQSKPNEAELEVVLREELGLPVMLYRRQPVPVGTTTEGE